MAAIQIVLQTSLGCCGLCSGALSRQLSAKSPSETQRQRGRERRKGPSSGPHGVDGKHRPAAADAPPNPTALSGPRQASGASDEPIFPKETQSRVPGRLSARGSPASLTGRRAAPFLPGPANTSPLGHTHVLHGSPATQTPA